MAKRKAPKRKKATSTRAKRGKGPLLAASGRAKRGAGSRAAGKRPAAKRATGKRPGTKRQAKAVSRAKKRAASRQAKDERCPKPRKAAVARKRSRACPEAACRRFAPPPATARPRAPDPRGNGADAAVLARHGPSWIGRSDRTRRNGRGARRTTPAWTRRLPAATSTSTSRTRTSAGDEAPGGDNPTPDQDIVDDIGKALGVEYQDNEELQSRRQGGRARSQSLGAGSGLRGGLQGQEIEVGRLTM